MTSKGIHTRVIMDTLNKELYFGNISALRFLTTYYCNSHIDQKRASDKQESILLTWRFVLCFVCLFYFICSVS